jgi:thioredoxin reductase
MCVGLACRPACSLCPQLTLGDDGGILVDQHMRTSVPHVFAAGVFYAMSLHFS